MSHPLRIPHPKTPLHLYRHLLRETSYLPPIARSFADEQVKDRFRRHAEDEEGPRKKHMRQAHHELRLLRAANAGDMIRMRRVLLRCFGRVGRRRRELMSELLHREVPEDTEELEKYVAEAAAIAAEDRDIDWLDSWDVEKLHALAKAHIPAGLVNPPKASITRNQIDPAKYIPAENSWGRPFAPKVARTKLKKMWKTAADKCMPPLPKEEWELLGSIAEGKVRDSQQLAPPRRALAQSAPDPKSGWNWQAYATKRVAMVDLQTNRRNKLLSGTVDDNTPTGDPPAVNRHNFTLRTWRRLLGNIWQLTPTVEAKPRGKGWDVTWGKLTFAAPPATKGNMEFFDDFPGAGKPQPVSGGRRHREA